MNMKTEKHTIELALTINLGDYSNIKVGHSIEREIEYDTIVERNRQLAALRIEVAQECGHQLVAALKPTEDDLRTAIKALIPVAQQRVILTNPAAVDILRKASGAYPASMRALEEFDKASADARDVPYQTPPADRELNPPNPADHIGHEGGVGVNTALDKLRRSESPSEVDEGDGHFDIETAEHDLDEHLANVRKNPLPDERDSHEDNSAFFVGMGPKIRLTGVAHETED